MRYTINSPSQKPRTLARILTRTLTLLQGSSASAASSIAINPFGSAATAIVVARVPDQTSLDFLNLTAPADEETLEEVFLVTVDRVALNGALITEVPFHFPCGCE